MGNLIIWITDSTRFTKTSLKFTKLRAFRSTNGVYYKGWFDLRVVIKKYLVNKTLVIDNEKYFTLSNSKISGTEGYHTDNKQTTPGDVKFKKKRKYEPKVLVWLMSILINV